MRVIYHPEAQSERLEAAEWYREEGGPALARRFRDELKVAIHRISATPHQFPVIHKNRRRALLSVFPYAIIFERMNDEIAVIAVAHNSRRPFYWRRRNMPESGLA